MNFHRLPPVLFDNLLMCVRLAAVGIVMSVFAGPAIGAAQAPQDAQITCESARQCEQQANDAIASGDHELAHSIAWRAFQKAPPNDTNVMYLVARTQSLSGRPHDAVVMLRRLAQLGFRAHDAETSDEFRRVRSLAQWPEVLALIRNTPAVHVEPAPAAPRETNAPAALRAPDRPSEAPVDRLAIARIRSIPVTLAYDSVSRRFVFADESGDTLKVVDELSGNVVNLVSQGWAGAYRVTATAIDGRRGDLWVTGVRDQADGSAHSAVFRLQLVSGRLLHTIELPADGGPSRVVGIAVRNGRVFVLDALGRRVYSLVPGAKSFEREYRVDVASPTAIAASDSSLLYISGAQGIASLDLNTQRTTAVALGGKSRPGPLQSLGWHRGSLFGIELAGGNRRAIRMLLDARGRAVTSLATLGSTPSRAMTIADDTLYFLAGDSSDDIMIKQLQISDPRKTQQ